jgi:hypothetical protein
VLSSEDYFADGIAGNMQSTVNSTALDRIISNHKARKSVVGLFDMPRPFDLPSSKIIDLPMPFTTEADPFRTGLRTSDTLHSPALSALSIAAPSPTSEKGVTLGSELGNQFGDEWDADAGNHHLRNTSLYQLAMPSTPSSPVSTACPVLAVETTTKELPNLQTPSLHVRSGLQHPQDQYSPSRANSPRSGHQTDRYRRMSETIHSRTNRWADSRFKETLSSKPISGQPVEGADPRVSLKPIQQRLASAFDSAVGVLANPGSGKEAASEAPDGDDSQKTMVSSTVANSRGVGKFIFELWLWLQFFIIILVFLWAMAKRGPKSVLGDAEKKRASTKHRS